MISQRLYRSISLLLACAFAVVGLTFLTFPDAVIQVFNNASRQVGMMQTPSSGHGFYLVLAVGYMYVVAVLAFLMYRHPGNGLMPVLLVNAKAASSILSFLFLIVSHPYLIYLANGIVDGIIALGVFMMQSRALKVQ
ncbi:MAG TPA: hypothetical protein VI758_00300 [Bacteroidota bacterium]